MKKSILLFVLTAIVSYSAVHAASLNKYNSHRATVAPKKAKTISTREKKIRQAVKNIKNASAKKKLRLIKQYKKLIDQAHKKELYRQASFYTEILKRVN